MVGSDECMKKVARIIVVILSVALLTGCARQSVDVAVAESQTMTCRSVTVEFSTILTGVTRWGGTSEAPWVWGTTEDGEDVLVWLNADGQVTASIRVPLPEENRTAQLMALTQADDGKFWGILQQEIPETDASCHSQLFLCCWTQDFMAESVVLLQLPTQENRQVGSFFSPTPEAFFIEENGELWLGMQQLLPVVQEEGQPTLYEAQSSLLHFSADGSLLQQLPLEGTLIAACRLSQGDLLCTVMENRTGRTRLAQLQSTAQGTAQLLMFTVPPLTDGGCSGFVLAGQETANTLLAWNSNGIYSFTLQQRQARPLLLWENVGLTSQEGIQVCGVLSAREKGFLAVTRQAGGWQLQWLTPGGGTTDSPSQELTLGVMGPLSDSLREQVQRFHAEQSDWRIRMIDYSDAAARKAGFDSGAEMLRWALLQGSAPDILSLDNAGILRGLTGKGVFVDLYPLLDADPELQRSDFLSGLLAACEVDGTLPTVVPAYMLSTAVGVPQTVGDLPDWSWEAFSAVMADSPQAAEPIYGLNRANALLQLVRQGGTAYLDYEAGVCHFDSPAFVQLLTASAAWPETASDINADPKQALTDGWSLVRFAYVTGFSSLRQFRYECNGAFVLKGFPGKGCGTSFVPTLQLAITSSCPDVQAAWQFVRSFLLQDFQDSVVQTAAWFSLPLRYDSLQKAAQVACQSQAEPTLPAYLTVEALTDSQLEYWKQGILPEDADVLLTLLENVSVLDVIDINVTQILLEEAAAFYSGAHTAAQTAALLQDRVQNYLSEQH